MGEHGERGQDAEIAAESRPESSSTVTVVATTAFIASLILFAWVMLHTVQGQHTNGGPASGVTARTQKTIAGVHCDALEYSDYHIHSHLSILDRTKAITVPQYIGIPADSCLYWLHTHDETGVIHVEAPAKFSPRLSAFFAIWGQPLSRSQVAGARVVAPLSMRVYVGHRLYTGDVRTIVLRDHEDITIEVGPPFRPPVSYDWSGF